MTFSARALLALLADGELHSGEQLAGRLGVTRAAVWKQVGELRGRGVAIESLERRGYRLAEPIELLDIARMRQASKLDELTLPEDLEILFEVDSTNDYLYREPAQSRGKVRVVFAELQSAGRGRRGRHWTSPVGSGLTFSVAWRFQEMPANLSALGLAIGVSVVRALRQVGAESVMLKWPNDIVAGGHKLGGLLVQLRSEVGGPAYAVIGLGFNVSLPRGFAASIAAPDALPASDLRTQLQGVMPGRNRLAARLTAAMIEALEQFEVDGFRSFAGDWRRFDSLRGLPVQLKQGDRVLEGTARGADPDGALCVEIDGHVQRFVSGDVSVRPVHEQTL
jgi:BirA family biotin operon repressor/biotin-[acetyl-CoA-carboxylase] ligase